MKTEMKTEEKQKLLGIQFRHIGQQAGEGVNP
jgi:hypothetical protein